MSDQDAPAELAVSGRRLWSAVTADYELEVHELLLLEQACRAADQLDRLAEEAAGQPVTVTNVKGDRVTHPAIVESRQQGLALSRLLASLRLPSGDESERPQRRGGARGSYGVRSVS